MRVAARLLCVWAILMLPTVAQAQLKPSLFGGARGGPSKPTATATLIAGDTPNVVSLQVKVTIPKGSNTYSQDPTFAKPTILTANTPPAWLPLDADFFPDHPPKREFDENFGKEVEKYVGEVVFLRRYELPAGQTVGSVEVEGLVDLLVCDTACVPVKLPFTAKLGTTALAAKEIAFPEKVVRPIAPAPAEVPAVVAPVTAGAEGIVKEIVPQRNGKPDPVRLRFELTPKAAKPGEAVQLKITMTLAEKWNTYSLVQAAGQRPLPTQIELQLENLSATSELLESPKPQIHVTQVGETVETSNAHEKEVTWTKNFTPVSASPYGVTGSITYMICEEQKTCMPPNLVAFALETSSSNAPRIDVLATANPTGPDNTTDAELARLFPVGDAAPGGMSFLSALWGAFFAGLIMNVMPCVLPVLSIKILSFAQQAGEKRSRVIGLNLAYTAGVLAVFGVLALSAIGIKEAVTRGEQTASVNAVLVQEEVLMTMGAVFFVMGLSLMGVFELPVPGIIPSASHHQEGYLGAFTTGIIATVLGTPCIAPFIAPVFTWAVLQSTAIIFLTFSMMALGMAAPYLLTGIFPQLVNWLPRPGMWMVRFKQFTGFVMLGTVLFLMASIDLAHLIPYLIILLGLGLGAWLAGTYAPPTLSYGRQFMGWVLSIAIVAPVVWFGLHEWKSSEPVGVWGVATAGGKSGPSAPKHGELPWQSFSQDEVFSLRKAGQPMIIDFTANWCVICKANERLALNTQATSDFVAKHNVIPIVADFTSQDPQMVKWLRHFGQESVPLTIIVPPGRDSQVIVLAGAYFQGGLLSKLEQALHTGTSPVAAQPPTVKPEATANKPGLFSETH